MKTFEETLRISTGNFYNQDMGINETLVKDRLLADDRFLNLYSRRHQETLKVSRVRLKPYGAPELIPWCRAFPKASSLSSTRSCDNSAPGDTVSRSLD